MSKVLRASVAVVGLALAGSAAEAQTRMLQFDINGAALQSLNSSGAPAPFGGLSATGSVVLHEQLPLTQLLAVSISTTSGAFVAQPGEPWGLTLLTLAITLANGQVTGGSLQLDIGGGEGTGGDTYRASVGASGHVSTFVGGGYTIDALTLNGAFSDPQFGAAPVADFFSSQSPPFLHGSFLLRMATPDPVTGVGTADVDAFVSNIPAPGSAACLVAALFIVSGRRRRR